MSLHRQQRADRLCVRLTAEIAGLIPRGIGSWGPAWEIVDPPTARFLEAVAEWEVGDEPDFSEKVRQAYREVVRSWELAAERFREAGGLEGVAAAGAGLQLTSGVGQ